MSHPHRSHFHQALFSFLAPLVVIAPLSPSRSAVLVLLTPPLSVTNRMTLDGGPYNEAIDKIQALGLQEKAESSGANRLGDRTRKVLTEEFGAGNEDDGANRIVVA